MKNKILLPIFLGLIALINTNVQAQNPVGNLQDLVGARGSSGESALQRRGYRFLRTDKSEAGVYQYWRESRSGRCVTIRVDQGRYQSFVYAPEFDCQNQASSGTGNETIRCRFNGQPLTCNVYVDRSEAATFVKVTFPDGFTRKMRFEQGDFYSDGLQVRTGLERGMFIVSNDNREYFEIPRAWFD